MIPQRILVVDDEPSIRHAIAEHLANSGYEVAQADSCLNAEKAIRAGGAEAAIVDYLLPDGNAIDLVGRLHQVEAALPIIVITGHGSIDLAVKAIKQGAEQFVTKPVDLAALELLVRRCVDNSRVQRRDSAHATEHARYDSDPFVGTSRAIRALSEQAHSVVRADVPVLLQGETGTGKGVLAKWLHANSARGGEPFVDINCAGLSRELMESELFGHDKGAFTGAVSVKMGLLEVADRGTVFLDEIGDVDAAIQPKLLKVLEDKTFRRVGDVRDRRTDIRLVAATHHNLADLVAAGGFRSDLYFRINTVEITIPPLRDRREDIPAIADSLLEHCSADLGRGEVALDEDAMDLLVHYAWPGNIRELRNVLERALLLTRGAILRAEDLQFGAAAASRAEETSSELTLEELEKRHIARVLKQENGHMKAAAQRLGISRSSLYQKVKTYRIAAGE